MSTINTLPDDSTTVCIRTLKQNKLKTEHLLTFSIHFLRKNNIKIELSNELGTYLRLRRKMTALHKK